MSLPVHLLEVAAKDVTDEINKSMRRTNMHLYLVMKLCLGNGQILRHPKAYTFDIEDTERWFDALVKKGKIMPFTPKELM